MESLRTHLRAGFTLWRELSAEQQAGGAQHERSPATASSTVASSDANGEQPPPPQQQTAGAQQQQQQQQRAADANGSTETSTSSADSNAPLAPSSIKRGSSGAGEPPRSLRSSSDGGPYKEAEDNAHKYGTFHGPAFGGPSTSRAAESIDGGMGSMLARERHEHYADIGGVGARSTPRSVTSPNVGGAAAAGYAHSDSVAVDMMRRGATGGSDEQQSRPQRKDRGHTSGLRSAPVTPLASAGARSSDVALNLNRSVSDGDRPRNEAAVANRTAGGDGNAADNNNNNNNNDAGVHRELREMRRLLQNPETRNLLDVLARVLPFVGLLLFKWLVEYFWPLVSVVVTVVVFALADVAIVRGHSRQRAGAAHRIRVVAAAAVLLLWIAVLLLAEPADRLWLALSPYSLYEPPPSLFDAPSACRPNATEAAAVYSHLHLARGQRLPECDSVARSGVAGFYLPVSDSGVSLFSALWTLFVADSCVKFAAMAVKCVIVLAPVRCLNMKRKRRLYQWIEYTHQFYRYTFIPPGVWLHYFLSISVSYNWFFISVSYALAVGYVLLKAVQLPSAVGRPWFKATMALCRSSTLGSRPTHRQLHEAGNQCSVCFSEFTQPVALVCGHIFCEDCIGTWLDKENTCPMCRKQVSRDDNMWKNAQTTRLVQIF